MVSNMVRFCVSCLITLLQIFIKDVKSSNGTFINGERLSPEGLESEPYELTLDDIVVRPTPWAIQTLTNLPTKESGIDIVGEDNKTIIHHKVAARVVCIFSEQDAHVAARAEHISRTNNNSNTSTPNMLTNNLLPLLPLRPLLESVVPDPLKRMDPGVFYSLCRG